MKNYPNNNGNYVCCQSDLDSFYSNLNDTNFIKINVDKLNQLKQDSKELNKFYNNPYTHYLKKLRYIKTMNRIKTNQELTEQAEKFILFMFSVDPEFEAFKIYSECNTTDEIKIKLIKKFDIVDKNLIKIEKFFIKNFLSEKKKKEIEKEIKERVFK